MLRAVDEFEEALSSDAFRDEETGYRRFIDVDSFVDYFLLSEITKNPDSYRGPAFFHKVWISDKITSELVANRTLGGRL